MRLRARRQVGWIAPKSCAVEARSGGGRLLRANGLEVSVGEGRQLPPTPTYSSNHWPPKERAPPLTGDPHTTTAATPAMGRPHPSTHGVPGRPWFSPLLVPPPAALPRPLSLFFPSAPSSPSAQGEAGGAGCGPGCCRWRLEERCSEDVGGAQVAGPVPGSWS